MIYQLMKRDPAWKTAWYLLLFAAGAALIEQDRSIVLMPLAMMLLAAASAAGQSQERTKGFLAALPIARQEIFLARVGALIALIWAPALAAAGICAATGRFGAAAFVSLAAIATPVVLIYQSLLIREIAVPRWANAAAISILCALFAASSALYPEMTAIPFLSLIAGGVAASAGIFMFTWNAIPSVGISGPFLAHETATKSRAASPRRFPSWLFSWWDLVWFAILFNLTFSGPWFSGVLFLCAGSMQNRPRFRLLDPLPVNRRLLLAARVFPLLAPLVGGYIVGIHLGFAGTNPWNKVYVSAGRQWPPTRAISQCGTPT